MSPPFNKLCVEFDSYNKIASWNLCLGLSNKKDIVIDYLKANNVEICCLQETEVDINFPVTELNCKNYNLELEDNDTKKRAGIYLHSGVNYVRRKDLESPNHHIVIVDITTSKKFCVINLYRSFHPQGNLSPDEFFKSQLGVLQKALCSNCLILGDFNLDARMELRLDYPRNYCWSTTVESMCLMILRCKDMCIRLFL